MARAPASQRDSFDDALEAFRSSESFNSSNIRHLKELIRLEFDLLDYLRDEDDHQRFQMTRKQRAQLKQVIAPPVRRVYDAALAGALADAARHEGNKHQYVEAMRDNFEDVWRAVRGLGR